MAVNSRTKQGSPRRSGGVPAGVGESVGVNRRRGGTNEQQGVTVSGATTGNIRLTFDGLQTGQIAFNANAATVQAALVALANIEVGDVVCGGGPLNTAEVTVTFGGKYANTDVPQITVQNDGADGSRSTDTNIAGVTQHGNPNLHDSRVGGSNFNQHIQGYQHPSRRG
jgi:hypothetical protein